MIPHPAFSTIFRSRTPVVQLLDLMDSVSDLTTYTFSNRSLARPFSNAGMTLGTDPGQRSSNNSVIIACIHSEDAISTWTVSSVTIGGVAMTVRRDRGGGTQLVNSAIFSVYPSALAAITTTDVVVTFSETVACCAVGIFEVSNLAYCQFVASSAVGGTGTNTPNPAVTTPAAEHDLSFFHCGAGTHDTSGTSMQISQGEASGSYRPTLIYEGSNADMSYAAWWTHGNFYPGLDTTNFTQQAITWSAVGSRDAVTTVWI